MLPLRTLTLQSLPIAALVAAGFSLGTYLVNVWPHAPARDAVEDSWCGLRNSSSSRSAHAVGSVDVAAIRAFLEMCRSYSGNRA